MVAFTRLGGRLRAAALATALLLAGCNDTPSKPVDRSAPTVSVTTHNGAGSWATNQASLALAGTAADDGTLVRVEWASDRGGSGVAAGTQSWTATVPLLEGANQVTIKAFDQEGNAGTAQVTVTLDTHPPHVEINSPNNERSIATAAASVELTGSAGDDRVLERVAWSTGAGKSGTATGTATWSLTAALEPGDNLVTVTAYDPAGNSASDQITVTYNPGVQVAQPVLNPGGVLVGRPTTVRVTAALGAHPGLVGGSVKLLRVTATNTVAGEVGTLVDDGDLSRGDEILGDGIFSGIFTFTEAQAGQVRLRVAAQTQSGAATQQSLSPVAALAVYTPVSVQEYQQVTATQQGALDRFKAFVAGQGVEAALDSAVRWLSARADVQRATRSQDGTIEIEYKSGLLGGVRINRVDPLHGASRGGVLASPDPPVRAGGSRPYRTVLPSGPAFAAATARADTLPRRTVRVPLSRQTRGMAPLPAARAALASATADSTEVQSRKVLIYEPFQSEFAPFDEGAAVAAVVAGSELQFEVTHLRNGAATVSALQGMADYGLVVLATHGDEGEYIFTGERSDTINLKTHQGLLREKKLAVFLNGTYVTGDSVKVTGGMYAVTSRFVRGLAGKFPHSIILNNSCESTKTAALSQAFRDRGALTYFGYTKDVWSDFAKARAVDLVTQLVRDLKTTGEAFQAGQADPTAPNAVFERNGSLKAHFGSGLINGDFEEGSLHGWTRAGDGRVIVRLGTQAPTGGAYMGIVSTGLGYTTSTGSIRQSFRVSATDSILTLRWNFLSEEFLEYVGSQYQDFFRVTLQHPAGTQVVFQRNIDQFNAQYTLVPVSPGVVFDQGGVYMTGWQTLTVDVRPYRGKVVTLLFATGDVGDSIYDSAVLLDDVRVQ